MKKIILGIVSLLAIFSFVGCGGKEAKKINVEEAANSIVTQLSGKTRELIKLEEDMAKGVLSDLSLVESYSVYGSMMSPLETVAIFEAKDGNVDKVKAELENTKKAKVEGAFYPAEKDAMENEEVAQIVVNGNYVALFILPDYDNFTATITNEAVEAFNKAFN